MKKILPILLFGLITVAFTTPVQAQKVYNEGTITMSITNATADDPQMQAALGMITNTQIVMSFNDKNSLVSMNLMGGMMTNKVLYKESGDGLMLLDAMGQKMAVVMSKEDFEAQQSEKPDINVEVDESDTKEILGLKCVKATISVGDGGPGLVAYCTKDIKTDAKFMKDFDTSQFPGFPVSYTISMEGMNLTFEMTEITDEVDVSMFNLTTDGYKVMTMEEMQKMGMGSGGFGF